MIIGKYIKQLLDERKRIVLPGFGNLEVKEAKEGTPTSGNRIDPPGLSVRFDPGFSKDDGLLASAFKAGEKIEEEEARQRVLELVDDVKFALDKGESYHIPETGSFSRDEDGKIFFKLDPGWVLDADQYGLESMDLLELEEQPVRKEKSQVAKPPPKEPAKKTSAVISETRQKATNDEKPVIKTSGPVTETHPPEKRPRRVIRWRVIWIVAGGLIIILIALITIPTDSIRKPRQAEPLNTVMEGADTEQPVISDDPSTEITNDEAETAVEEPQSAVETNNFFIVAGSFRELQNASDLQDRLKAKGYAAEVMITENRMYRVSLSSYATLEEAERALAGVKAVQGLQSCWLLSN